MIAAIFGADTTSDGYAMAYAEYGRERDAVLMERIAKTLGWQMAVSRRVLERLVLDGYLNAAEAARVLAEEEP